MDFLSVQTSNEMCAMGHQEELRAVILMASSTNTTKTKDLAKYVTHDADYHFGTWCPRCSWASSHSTGSDYMHTITTHFCNTTCIMQLGRSIHMWLKKAIITQDNPTANQQTLAFWLGSDETPSLFSWPWSMWLWLDFKTKSHCVGNHLQRERILWQQFALRWQRLACQVLPMVFVAYPIIDKEL